MYRVLILLAVIFPFVYKYTYVLNNQYEHIPVILSFLDPDYLAKDWYVNVSRSFGPRTFFAYYMAVTSRLLTLPGTFFMHYLLYIFLVSLATFRLSRLLFRSDWISLLTVISVLFGSTYSLGGNYLITRDFFASQLPMGLLLYGITGLLERKFFLSAVCFSFAAYLHPQVGIIGGTVSFFAYQIARIDKTRTVHVVNSFLLFNVINLPLYFLYKKEIGNSFLGGNRSELIDIIVYMRGPHHFLPSSWPAEHYFWFLAMLLIFGFLLKSLYKKHKNIIRFLSSLTAIILILCVFGYVGTEWYPVYPVIIAQFFRFTLLIYWMSAILIYGTAFDLVTTGKSNRFLLFIPLFLPFIRNIRYDKAFWASILLLSGLVIFSRKLPKLIFASFLIIGFGLQHYHERLNLNSITGHPTTETTVALWIKNNTPKKSVILTPPEFEKFRVVSERAIVVDRKSFPFEKNAIRQWAERICYIANFPDCAYRKMSLSVAVKGYDSLTVGDLERLRKKYGFGYIVGRSQLPLEIMYADSGLYVYKWPAE